MRTNIDDNDFLFCSTPINMLIFRRLLKNIKKHLLRLKNRICKQTQEDRQRHRKRTLKVNLDIAFFCTENHFHFAFLCLFSYFFLKWVTALKFLLLLHYQLPESFSRANVSLLYPLLLTSIPLPWNFPKAPNPSLQTHPDSTIPTFYTTSPELTFVQKAQPSITTPPARSRQLAFDFWPLQRKRPFKSIQRS